MRKWYLAIAIVLSITAGLLVYSNTSSALKTEKVAVWAKDLQPGEVIKEEDLKLIDYPQTLAPKNAIPTPKALVGRVLQVPVVSGDIARESQVVVSLPESDMAGYLQELSQRDNNGETYFYGFALPASLTTTVGDVIKFGDRVDLFVLKEGRVLYGIENVQVLNVNKEKSIVLALPEETIPHMAIFSSMKADFVVSLKPKGHETKGELIQSFFSIPQPQTQSEKTIETR